MNSLTSLFLSQSYKDARADYMRAVNDADFTVWDYVIITASNEKQASVYNKQLEIRKQSGLLPCDTHFAVVPDYKGKRVGSGGATLSVLQYIANFENTCDFSGLKILVIHSGGDSKRVPQYSALGKLFSPVPAILPCGRPSSLFDEFMTVTASIPTRIRSGMLVVSGDVLLLFNPLQIDYFGSDAAAISFKADVNTGKNHGVFLRGDDGYVTRFLHKRSVEELKSNGAVDENDNVDIDTGAILFSEEILSSLYGLLLTDGKPDKTKIDKYINDKTRLSLYADFLFPLASDSTLDMYYKETPEGEFSDELISARNDLWHILSPYRLKLFCMKPAKFIHFGTSGEILNFMTKDVDDYTHLEWKKQINCFLPSHVSGYNSVARKNVKFEAGSYIENSFIHGSSHIGKNTIISQIELCDVKVPDDVVLHCLRLDNGKYCVRIYGVKDNPKDSINNGIGFLNSSINDFMAKYNLSTKDLWDDISCTLWLSKLFSLCDTMSEAVDSALNLYNLMHGNGDFKKWYESERISLEYGFNNADSDFIIEWNEYIDNVVKSEFVAFDIHNKVPVQEIIERSKISVLNDYYTKWLDEQLKKKDYMYSMRLHYYLAHSLDDVKAREFHLNETFKCIKEAVVSGYEVSKYKSNKKIVKDFHSVQLPLRVDWAGPWTDAPPYCLENGGAVLNSALLLNGKKPVQVTLKRIDEPKIVFDSRDMDSHGEFTDISLLQDTGNPFDHFALQKSALIACGIIPSEGGNLEDILTSMGGGFIMNSEVEGVPKGSGLGTSSILSAACVKALLDFVGDSYTDDDVYSYVLAIEQIMSTGGGWQDQAGGLTNGIKLVTSNAGISQKLDVKHLNVSEETKIELNNRFALIYTGQRRLARNILRDVVGRYIAGEKDSVSALESIGNLSYTMSDSLENGDIDDFAKQLDRHWELLKQLEPSTTNSVIDCILASIEELIDARMICGAGGGGFLYVIMKKGVSKKEISDRLASVFGNNVSVWDCELI